MARVPLPRVKPFLHFHDKGTCMNTAFSPLDAAIDRAIAEQRIVGTVVLAAHQGRLVYRLAAGLADREAGRPMTEDAIFLLASVTKPMVASAVLRLVEQGHMQLDDPITRWLPGFEPRLADGSAPVITIHQLLTHTAGLTYTFMEPEGGPYHALGVSSGLDAPGLGLQENLRRLAEAPLAYAPGTGWGYSMATDVLGAAVAAASGEPLPEAVRRLVAEPLGMSADTAFTVRERARLVAHYGDGRPRPERMGEEHTVPFNGAPVRFAPGRIFDPASYPSGGAGMAGTAADVLKLVEALRTGHPRMREAMVGAEAQTQGPGWGFGYAGAVLIDPAAAGTPQSRGTVQWGGAYGHNWFVDAQRDLSVVALTNTAFEGMAGPTTVEVRNAVYASLA